MRDSGGGHIPATKSEMRRAKNADLITLPPRILGTNCGNCMYVNNGFCEHPSVFQPVTKRQCCVYWDAKGVIRPWED